MAVGRDGRTFSFEAGEDLSDKLGYLAYLNGDKLMLGKPGKICFPIVDTAKLGETASVGMRGSAKVFAGGTFVSGDAYTSDGDGKAVKALAGDAVCGIALGKAVNGAIFEGLSQPSGANGIYWDTAGASLVNSEGLLMNISATGTIVKATSATGGPLYPLVYGAASGSMVAIKIAGVARVTAKDTINEGDAITTDANSKGDATTTAANNVAGFALTTAVANGDFLMSISHFRY